MSRFGSGVSLTGSVGDLFRVVGGGTPPTARSELWTGPIPWLTSADIRDDGTLVARRWISQEAVTQSAANLVPAGSVIVATRVGLGKVGVADQPVAFSQDCQALIVDGVPVRSKFAALQMSVLAQSFRAMARGTTIAGITKRQLLELPFRLPSLAEQDAAVARIDLNLSRLESAAVGLAKAKADLAMYREALFADLLAGIAESHSLIDLCAVFVDCEHRTPKYGTGTIPALRPRDLVGGRMDLESAGRVSEEEYLRQTVRHVPQSGDIVYSRELSYGWCAPIPSGTRLCLGQGVVVFRPQPKLLVDWLVMYLNSPLGRRQARVAASGTAHPHINLGAIKAYDIPVPPLREQATRLQEAERRFSLVAQLDAEISAGLRRAISLRRSIIADGIWSRTDRSQAFVEHIGSAIGVGS